MADDGITIRTRFRHRVRELTNGSTSVVAAQVSAQALEQLEAEEPGFTNRLGQASAEQMAHEEALGEIGTSRSRALFNQLTDPTVTTRRRGAQSIGVRLMERFEYVGDGHIVIGKMTRPALLKAADLRKERAKAELRVAAFERQLAAGMPDDEKTVDEVYAPKAVEGIFRRVLGDLDVEAILRAFGDEPPELGGVPAAP